MKSNVEHPRTTIRQIPRNVWVATATSFLTDISSEMLFHLLPLFLANVLGTSTVLIGLIEGLAETTSSLLKALSGWLADRWGRKKELAVGGYGLSALTKPLLYFATSWGAVLAVRLGDRIGKGIRTAPRDALIADSVSDHQRGLAFGLHRAGDTAGAFVGLAIAFGVVWATQANALTISRATFQTLVLISTVPALLGVAVLAFGAKEVRTKGVTTLPKWRWHDLSPDFRYLLVVVALFTLGNSADGFLVLRAQERGVSVLGILGILLTFTFIYTVASGPLGAWSDKIGRKRLLIAGLAWYALLYLGFALATEVWHIWLLYGLYGLYYAATEGTAKALVADLIPAGERGGAYGIYNAVIGFAALPGSVLAGVLWQGIGGWAGFGPQAPFIAGAVLATLAALLLLFYHPTTVQTVSE